MIKLLENNQLPSADFADGFSATKIKANMLSYGCGYPFLTFWCQYINDSACALICKMEGAITVVSTPLADTKELKDFVDTIGFTALNGHPDLLKKIGFPPTFEYTVVCKRGEEKSVISPDPPSIKRVYEILFERETPHIKKGGFESFYADLSHRIRHGTAAAVIYKDSAVAVASHITETSAVISGVATLACQSKKGYGTEALRELTKQLYRRNVFAAAEKSVVPFYIKNGFAEIGKTAIYETEE